MLAEKAVELLKQRHSEDTNHSEADLYKADQLGIEALEFYTSYRDGMPEDKRPTLPSEGP